MTKMIDVKAVKTLNQSLESGEIELNALIESSDVMESEDAGVTKRKTVKTLEMKLQKIKEAINISVQDRALRQHLAYYNFGEERFLEGLNLIGKMDAIILELLDVRATKLNTTRNAQLKRKQAYDTFIRFRKIGRIAFENNREMRSILMLHKPVSKTYAIWLIQAKTFYDTVFNYREVVAEYAGYQVSLEQLEEGRRQVLEAENAVTQSVDMTAHSQVLTGEKNRNYKTLLDWWSEFKTILRIVLKKFPILLEKSEILVLKRTGAKKTGTHSRSINTVNTEKPDHPNALIPAPGENITIPPLFH